ncbi:MAG: alpha-tubulin suppressor-like RCC1 family protein, partial [Verrucomicrobiales bacterium]
TINDMPPSVAYFTPATYTVDQPISPNQPSSTGGAVVSYSVSPTLPAGLTLNTTTGVIIGTPTAVSATASYIVTATNSGGSATVSLTITVDDILVAPSSLTYSSNPAVYTKDTEIAVNTPTSSGDAVDSYSLSPLLPAGLLLNPTTGVISGTPTAVTAAASYTVTATNIGGSTSTMLSISVSVITLPEIDITGNATSIPNGNTAVSTSTHTDFGAATIAGDAVVRTFTIHNSGTADLNLTGGPDLVTVTAGSGFSVTAQPNSPGVVPLNQSATFQVSFTPESVGTHTASVTIPNDDSDESPYNFVIQGVGEVPLVPEIDITGNGIGIAAGDFSPDLGDHTDFGEVLVGAESVRAYTIRNSGTIDLNLTGAPNLVTVSGSTEFSVSGPTSQVIAPGHFTIFTVAFHPVATGDHSAMVSVSSDDGEENAYEFAIEGNADIADTNLTTDLVAYWPFNGDLEDKAGTSDGTAMGTGPIAYGSGKFGQGIDLNGEDQYVATPAENEGMFDFDGGQAFSVSAWFRVDAFDTGWQCLMAKGEGNSWRIHRRGVGNMNLLTANGGSGDLGEGDFSSINDGEIHHLVLVSDPGAGAVRLYIDGQEGATGGAPSAENNSKAMLIGENPVSPGREWEGLIDDVAIWKRSLTGDEVALIWNGGVGTEIATGLGPVNPPIDSISAFVDASFASASEVPWSVDELTATGRTISFSLNFAPTYGTELMAVDNTGLGSFSGTFDNLADGQNVPLSFGGVDYPFVASYFGGSGNDLVLVWNSIPDFLDTSFASETVVPWSVDELTATGRTIDFSLNFAPTHGTELMVVDNTGLSFIFGTFDNLAHGQTVILNFGGVDYPFVASYYGGTGNDLVLVWKDAQPYAWGKNENGQLGNGDQVNRTKPESVDMSGILADKTVLSVAVGESHSLAHCADGTVAAWGSNTFGELGDGSEVEHSSPVLVDRGIGSALFEKTVVAVAAGRHFSLALCSDGTVASWGLNEVGQLGNGTQINTSIPMDVITNNTAISGKQVVAIAAGMAHSLALSSEGRVSAWGLNSDGQLGDGTDSPWMNRSLATAVAQTGQSALNNQIVTAIAAGSSNSLAMTSDETFATWGLGGRSFLHQGVNVPYDWSSRFVNIDNNSVPRPRAIASGGNHHLTIIEPGWIAAWGGGPSGQLGRGSNIFNLAHQAPAPVYSVGPPYSSMSAIAAGANHSLSVRLDGMVEAWGGNDFGQLGDGTVGNKYFPVLVENETLPPLARFVGLAKGSTSNHTIALVANPLPDPEINITGNGAPIPSGGDRIPSVVVDTDFGVTVGSVFNSVRSFTIENLGLTNLILTGDPVVEVTGDNPQDFTVTLQPQARIIPPNSRVDAGTLTFQIAFTPSQIGLRRATIRIANNDSDKTPYTFAIQGTGGSNVLSADYTTGREVPLKVNSFTATGNTVQFALNHAPATGTELTVVENAGLDFISGTFDNLGHGETVVLHFGGLPYHFVANYYGRDGNDLVLVWKNTGAYAWGANASGQLGFSSGAGNSFSKTLGAVPISGVLSGKTVVALAAGVSHSLALCSDGTLAAWGLNSAGQLGFGSDFSSHIPPGAVSTQSALSGKSVVAVAAGGNHSLALCSDGTVASWGSNFNGELGIGIDGPETNRDTPQAVATDTALSGKTVVAIFAGGATSRALCSDGTVASWGWNIGNKPVLNGALHGKSVVAISAGHALCSDGSLVGFDGEVVNASSPTSALFQKRVIGIASGVGHHLALRSDGRLAAWGDGRVGQLGNGLFDDVKDPTWSLQDHFQAFYREVPVEIDGLHDKTVVAFAAGDQYSIALASDGTLASWGSNEVGQLGNGQSVDGQYRRPGGINHTLDPRNRFTGIFKGSVGSHTLAMVAHPPALRLPHDRDALQIDGNLYVFGEDDANAGDVITIELGTVANQFNVSFGGTVVSVNDITGRIIVFGQAGDDDLRLIDDITLSAEIHGGPGNDTLKGGAGDDLLFGEEGDDVDIASLGHDDFEGGAGEEDGVAIFGTPGNDNIRVTWYLIDDDLDPDVVVHPPFPKHGDGLRVFINDDQVFDMTYTPQDDFETIFVYGGGGDDRIVMEDDAAGQHWNAEFYGEEGNDTLIGARNLSDKHLRGRDRLFGGPDNDILIGNSGNDFLDGGSGIDGIDGGIGVNHIVTDGLDELILNSSDTVDLVVNDSSAQTAEIDWGDGTEEPGTVDLAKGQIQGSHTYDLVGPGQRTIRVTTVDASGTTSTNPIQATFINGLLTEVPGPLEVEVISEELLGVTYPAVPGSTYMLEASEDLISWTVIGQTLSDLDGFARFEVAEWSHHPVQYFRGRAFAPGDEVEDHHEHEGE